MKNILANVKALSLELPACPPPLAAYIPATRTENMIYVSGQLPIQKGKIIEGRVPLTLEETKAKEAAKLCFLNALAAALSVLNPEKETLQLLKMEGFVQTTQEFHEEASVLNGASELAVQILGENGKHARTAIGVISLPKNAAVEISCIFKAIQK